MRGGDLTCACAAVVIIRATAVHQAFTVTSYISCLVCLVFLMHLSVTQLAGDLRPRLLSLEEQQEYVALY